MTLSFYLGWITGCLTILAIAPWRPAAAPKPYLIGRDALVPRSVGLPTAWRRRSK